VARGDPVFMRVDIDKILTGEKISPLPGDDFKVYMVLWGLAVKCHTYVLSRAMSDPRYVEGTAKIGPRKGRRSMRTILQGLSEIGLIEILPSGRIRVIGVKEVHPKLLWDKCPENVPISDPI
jgi:hypothetical protein